MNGPSNLSKIDQENALNICKFFIKSGQNLFLFGRRGIGKTHIILQAAKECGVKVNYINLSVIERPDLAGYPDLNSKNDIVTFKSPYFLPSLKEDENSDSIILFDEIDKASPEVTAPLLEILQFKKINGKNINAKACLLTGNLIEEGSNSNLISTALLDRGAKFLLNFDSDKWFDWALANNIHELILGFLQSNPLFICGKIDDLSYASPSPRGWTYASEALKKAKSLKVNDTETIHHIISGFVGYEAGFTFKIWHEYFKKYEAIAHSIIDFGEINFDLSQLNKTELLVFALTASMYAKQKTLSNKNNSNKFLFLQHLCKLLNQSMIENEIKLVALSSVFNYDLIVKYELYSCVEFYNLFDFLSKNIQKNLSKKLNNFKK